MQGPARAVAAASGKLELTLEQVRDRLALTATQQSAWSTYEAKVMAYTEDFYREKPVLASQESTAPQQIARLVDKLQNRLAAMEEVEFAAKNLYAALTPEQQKTANQLLLATIPSFAPTGSERPDGEERRKGVKPEGAGRSHRGGPGMGAAMGGGGG